MEKNETKVAVTVAEMARMVGLSRQRFYQLVGKTFPHPIYDTTTRRPFYTQELQEQCLEVRRRNCGIDGRPVLFYARAYRPELPPKASRLVTPVRKEPAKDEHQDILVAIRALGLVTATAEQVGSAIRDAFPSGVGDTSQGQVIRQVFVRLQRQNCGDIVGR